MSRVAPRSELGPWTRDHPGLRVIGASGRDNAANKRAQMAALASQGHSSVTMPERDCGGPLLHALRADWCAQYRRRAQLVCSPM